MRKSWLVASLWLSGWVGCKSSTPQVEPITAPTLAVEAKTPEADLAKPAAPRPDELTNVFLYRVEKDGVVNHLFGTMHMGVDPGRLPARVWNALAAAKTFAMETNLADPKALTAVFRKDGKTLQDDLGADYWDKFKAQAGNMADGMKNMKPFAVISFLQMKDLPKTAAMDMELFMKADKAKLPVEYLEPVEYQLSVVEKWLTADMLKKMLDQPDLGKSESARLLKAYEAGDEAQVQALFGDVKSYEAMGMTAKDIAAFKQELLYTRNTNWVAKLDGGLLQRGGLLAAVGAGHLIGENSVVEQLTKRGYTITKVAQ